MHDKIDESAEFEKWRGEQIASLQRMGYPDAAKAFRNHGSLHWAGWQARAALAATPAAPVAQEPVAWPDEIHQMAFEEGQPAENGDGYSFTAEEFDLFVERLLVRAAPPAAEQPNHSAAADMVWCACGDGYPALSYGAGFISGSGMCENCDAALPAKDMAAEPDTVKAPRELLAEAESIIESYAEALKASHAPGGDWEGEEAAHDEYELEAGVASKLRALLAGGAE